MKIIGKSSMRGREYTDAAIAGAVHLYEGAEVNVEHPRDESQQLKTRPILEGWGRLKNVRHVPGDGAYGDLHYLDNHPHTPLFLERIEKGFPIGLSQNARGVWSTKGGRTIVESIPHVISVDLVRRGATTKTLFESEPMETFNVNRFRLPQTTAGVRAFLRGGCLLEDVTGDSMDPTPGGPTAPAGAAGGPIKAALIAAIAAKLPSLDAAGLRKVMIAVGIGDSILKTLGSDGDSVMESHPGGMGRLAKLPGTTAGVRSLLRNGR